MKEIRNVRVNGTEVPVVISDEKEALLAAKAAGRAIVGLWRPEMGMDAVSPARYVVEDMEDVTGDFLERVARRRLGLPWKICETNRLVIRELFGDDFDEVWENRVGRGFGTVEEFLAYTEHQYSFYEFGIWALVNKETKELAGVAGLKIPEDKKDGEREGIRIGVLNTARSGDICLELGYHIFPPFRRRGYGRESCEAILRYGREELEVSRFIVRISDDNAASQKLAASLGFRFI